MNNNSNIGMSELIHGEYDKNFQGICFGFAL